MTRESLLREVTRDLRSAGLHASIVVRDLLDGREVSIDADSVWPLASVAKLPLALAVLLLTADGRLKAEQQIEVVPDRPRAGSGGERFRFPALIALDDLVDLALTTSDNAAADALLALVGAEALQERLTLQHVRGLSLRHSFRDLARTPLEGAAHGDRHLAQTLAIRGVTPASGHPIPQLDISRTNSGTARAIADLLNRIWTADDLPPAVAERLRHLLGRNLIRHRLAPDLAADDAVWSSKTGTLLHLRHEAGVLQHVDGERYAVVVLSRSEVPAATQPAADAALGAAARAMHDHLRGRLGN